MDGTLSLPAHRLHHVRLLPKSRVRTKGHDQKFGTVTDVNEADGYVVVNWDRHEITGIADVVPVENIPESTQKISDVKFLPNWDRFGWDAGDDDVHAKVARRYKSMVNNGHRVAIVSARNERVRSVTQLWLHHNNLPQPPAGLHLRGDNDFRPDNVFKQELLFELRDQFGLWPDLVFDDRNQVVEMWRSYGIRTIQVVKDGDF